MDSGGTHNYVTDGDAPAAPVLSDGSAVYTPGLSENRSGTSAFYHGDSIGSNRDITNSSQSVTDTRRYDAFGNLMQTSGSNPTPFGFAGSVQYQTDGDSGLKLLGHRYYDPTIGRFISRDPAYAGTNWYAYCKNGPLGATDRDGLLVTPTVWSRVVVNLISVIINFFSPPTTVTPIDLDPKPPIERGAPEGSGAFRGGTAAGGEPPAGPTPPDPPVDDPPGDPAPTIPRGIGATLGSRGFAPLEPSPGSLEFIIIEPEPVLGGGGSEGLPPPPAIGGGGFPPDMPTPE